VGTVSVIDQAGVTVGVDPDTIHRKGDRVTMWELIDSEIIRIVTDTSFLFTRLQREYDCARDLHRTLALTKLSGNMGTGKVILTTSDEQKWNQSTQGVLRNVYENLRATRSGRAANAAVEKRRGENESAVGYRRR
jgi:hypothetical protein